MMYTCCYCLHKDVNTVRQYNKSFLKYMNCSVDILFVLCATQNQKKSQLTSCCPDPFFVSRLHRWNFKFCLFWELQQKLNTKLYLCFIFILHEYSIFRKSIYNVDVLYFSCHYYQHLLSFSWQSWANFNSVCLQRRHS